MEILIAFIVFAVCFAGMAIGFIIKNQALKKGCSIDPDSCACRAEGKDPNECDQ